MQLAVGFFLRERPVFALATVATVVVSLLFSAMHDHLLIKKSNIKFFTGNLDSVSICFGCADSAIPLSKKPLLQLALSFQSLVGIQKPIYIGL